MARNITIRMSPFTALNITGGVEATSELGTASAVVGGGGIAPTLLEDFSTYASTANMLADPRGIYSVGEDIYVPGEITLDTTDGYGTSTQSMKYNFPNNGATCTDYTIGRNINFGTTYTEVWIEVAAKFMSGFKTDAGAGVACNPEQKFIFIRVNGIAGRFNLNVGTFPAPGSAFTFGPPGDEQGNGGTPAGTFGNCASEIWDGAWHVYRLYARTGAGGICKFWLDGTLRKSFTGLALSGVNMYGIALGRNCNQGPSPAQFYKWGRIAVYTTDPGW